MHQESLALVVWDDLTGGRLDGAVRRLDPAPTCALTDTEQHHADDLRARILGSVPDANIPGPPPPPPEAPAPPPRRRRRLALAGGAVVAVTAGLLAAPLFGDEERRPAAWSATPTILPGDDARELGEDCLTTAERQFNESTGNRGPAGLDFPPDGSFEPEQRRSMTLAIGERRGPFDLVVLGNAAGYELTCSSHDGVDSGAAWGTCPLLSPNTTSVSVGGSAESWEAVDDGRFRRETARTAFGPVGRDVTGVTLSTSVGPVTASVTNGWFAAVWPSADHVDGDPFKGVTITLTLADGTRTSPAAFASFPQRDVPPELLEPTPSPT